MYIVVYHYCLNLVAFDRHWHPNWATTTKQLWTLLLLLLLHKTYTQNKIDVQSLIDVRSSNRRPLTSLLVSQITVQIEDILKSASFPNSHIYRPVYTNKFAMKNNCKDSFFLICPPPFFNIINRGGIYFGGPRKSDIVMNKAHDP